MFQNRFKDNGKDKLTNFVVFFIIAPLVSITFAYFAVNHFIMPKLENKAETINQSLQENQDKDEDVTTSFPAPQPEETQDGQDIKNYSQECKFKNVDFFSVQVGSFSSLENAKIFLEQMKDNLVSGFIVKVEESYKVYSGVFTDRNDANTHKDKVKEKYTDAFISSNLINGGVIKYTEKQQPQIKQLVEIIDSLKTSYEQESKIWLGSSETKDIEEVTLSIQDNNKSIKEKISKINIEIKHDIFNSVKDQILKNIENRQKLADSKDSIEFVSLYNQYNKCMVDYLNIIKLN
ncbi:SPOR domain-containing protein [Clostridiaceae bacterium M8S5]|nr:SPOR domain-containing protein [Clostridiaceae bacterium M8S5]